VTRALAARDHAAFSAMIYAGLRIEETTALTVDDLSFSRARARGAEEVRVARQGQQGAAGADGTEAQEVLASLP
jgi:site-specific recombinase XerC